MFEYEFSYEDNTVLSGLRTWTLSLSLLLMLFGGLGLVSIATSTVDPLGLANMGAIFASGACLWWVSKALKKVMTSMGEGEDIANLMKALKAFVIYFGLEVVLLIVSILPQFL